MKPAPGESPVERVRVAITRGALLLVTAVFLLGLISSASGFPEQSTRFFLWGIVLLVATPVVGIIAALVEEVRRKDWVFAAAAALVLAFIGFSFIVKWAWQ